MTAEEQEQHRRKLENQLDEALADSFPASDPVSIVTSQEEEDWGEPNKFGAGTAGAEVTATIFYLEPACRRGLTAALRAGPRQKARLLPLLARAGHATFAAHQALSRQLSNQTSCN